MFFANRRVAVTIVIAAVGLAGRWALAGTQAQSNATRALQRLADKQGHPQAAAKQLKNLGYNVPPEMEADAAGVKPDDIHRALDKGGPLTSRLETVRGKPLSTTETQRVGDAQREYSRQMNTSRQKLVRDIARTLDLPEAKVRRIFARDTGKPEGQKKSVAELGRLLGHQLSEGDANRVASARGEFNKVYQSQRSILATQVATAVKLPPAVIRELLP